MTGARDPLDLLCDWIDVPSVTGGEAAYGDALARHLASAGFDVERQHVESRDVESRDGAGERRFNVVARAEEPVVVLCTHLDTVPPWIAPSRDRRAVYGRGSCDAKGPALAMIEAARRLLDAGERRIGFLFTVGEETDGAGARAANEAELGWRPRYTIVGEPTDNRFVRGHKGVFKLDLVARGVAGHSSQDVGPSAVHALVETLARCLAADWGDDPLFGRATLNVGCVHGGVAPNVVADRARAEIVLRAVTEPDDVRARLEPLVGRHVAIELGKGYGPIEFVVPADLGDEPSDADGAPAPIVAFGTDAPYLTRWGERLLYGPGSILDAHTDHEKLERASFERAVADYERVARLLCERAAAERRAP